MAKDLSSALDTHIRWLLTTTCNSISRRFEVLLASGIHTHANTNTHFGAYLLIPALERDRVKDPISILQKNRGSHMCMHGFYMRARDLNSNPQALTK